MPEQYRINERVRVVVEGFVTHTTDGEELYPGELAIALETTAGLYDVTVPLDGAKVERLAPDVQHREVWQDRDGDPWFAVRVLVAGTPRTMMLPGEFYDLKSAELSALSPEDVNRRYGPITRVFPLPSPTAAQPPAEQPDAPRVMLCDIWEDGDGDEWKVVEQDGRPLLLTWDGETRTWEGADSLYGPFTLVQRAGYRPTGGTVPTERLTIGMVVSCPEWVGGAPVRLTAPRRRGDEFAYELFGDGEAGVGVAGPGAVFTVWEPARNEGAR